MNKLYFRILGFFALYLIVVNVCSFLAGFNSNQLYNVFYLKNRTLACSYLVKNIVMETGVNVKPSTKEEAFAIIEKAAKKYGIKHNTLASLVTGTEFGITLKGGMGITSISPELFHSTGFKDPFHIEENINAAAEVLRKFIDDGTPEKELLAKFKSSGRLE